jgi:hypothetical protein
MKLVKLARPAVQPLDLAKVLERALRQGQAHVVQAAAKGRPRMPFGHLERLVPYKLMENCYSLHKFVRGGEKLISIVREDHCDAIL